MSDLHARLRGVIEERLALAKAAEGRTGEWEAWHIQEDDLPERYLVIQSGLPVYRMASVETPERSRFIAAHDPADAIRRHEAALRVLERHRPCACDLSRDMPHCLTHRCPADRVDVEIVDLAASYGVPVESEASDD